MNLSAPLPLSYELQRGDRVFLRFNVTTTLGQPIATLLNDFFSKFESAHVSDFELEGFPVFDPVAGTVNMIVRVHGTPLVYVVLIILSFAAFLLLREARLILSATASAVKSAGEGVENALSGLGVGLAVAGVVAAAFLLGWLDLRG